MTNIKSGPRFAKICILPRMMSGRVMFIHLKQFASCFVANQNFCFVCCNKNHDTKSWKYILLFFCCPAKILFTSHFSSSSGTLIVTCFIFSKYGVSDWKQSMHYVSRLLLVGDTVLEGENGVMFLWLMTDRERCAGSRAKGQLSWKPFCIRFLRKPGSCR